jgi:hypothetical protein
MADGRKKKYPKREATFRIGASKKNEGSGLLLFIE